MTGRDPSWQVFLAPRREPLEKRLTEITADGEPGEVVVVVRSGLDEKRLTRALGPGVAVTTLARFLGRSGPHQIEDEDLLPDPVPLWLVQEALPQGYQAAARQHLATIFLEAIHLLEENAIQPPYPDPDRLPREMEVHLEAAHRALLQGLRVHHQAGRYAAFERVSLAREGPSRFRVAFPAAKRVLFFAIDRLSPAERGSLLNVLPQDLIVQWLVVGTRPDADGHPGLAFTRPLVRWLESQGRPHALDAGEGGHDGGGDDGAGRIPFLASLFALSPHEPRRLEGVYLDAPGGDDEDGDGIAPPPRDRVEEAHRLLTRIRRLLDDGVPPHEVGVIVPALADYHGLLEDLFAEYRVPMAMSYRGSLRSSPAGSFLNALLEAMNSGLGRDPVLDLVAHPLASFSASAEQGAGDPVRWALDANRLRVWLLEAGWNPRGRDGAGGWERALEAVRRLKEQEAGQRAGKEAGKEAGKATGKQAGQEIGSGAGKATGEPASRAGFPAGEFMRSQLSGLRRVVDALATLDTESDPVALLAGIRGLMDSARMRQRVLSATRSAADPAYLLAAHRGVVELLDEVEDAFRLAGPRRTGASSVREVLRRLLATREVPLAVDPEDGVQLVSWRNAQGASFRFAFVIGATQDALAQPDESVAVEELLRPRFANRLEVLDPAAEAHRILHGILADTRGQVVLSSPKEDAQAPLVRSVLLDELSECFEIPRAQPPGAVVYTQREAARVAVQDRLSLAEPPAHAGPAGCLVAERARGDRPGFYSGRIVDERVLHSPGVQGVTGRGAVSAGRLSDFAKCPFRALVVNALNVRSPWERDEELDPRDKGGILHEVLERYMEKAMKREGLPFRLVPEKRKAHEALLLQEALVVVAEKRRRSMAFQAFESSLLGGLRGASNPYSPSPPGLLVRFLDTLERFGEGEGVVAVEVPFAPAGAGKPGADSKADGSRLAEEPDASGAEPPEAFVRVDTPGGAVNVRGRIDRLDRIRGDDGGLALRVVEYKSGRVPARVLVQGGVEFQLPLYAWVAGVMNPGLDVHEAVYHQMKRPRRDEAGIVRSTRFVRGGKHDLGALLSQTPRRVGEILSAQKAGRFPLTLLDEKEAGCDWCELRRGCGLRPETVGLRRESARSIKHHEGAEVAGYVPDRVDLPVGDPDPREDADEGDSS